MIIIKKETVVQTCSGCPSQWDAETIDRRAVYVRVRHGYFRLEVDGTTRFDGHPDGIDGVMNTDEMIEYVNKNNEDMIKII